MHQANRRSWDATSPHWQAGVDSEGKWRTCHLDPGLALRKEEQEWLVDVSGKRVCVLGSGDNLVVFALSGMGARVTSVDISQVQLDIAAERASRLGLDIVFVRADVTDLAPLADDTFDLVYTGGHVAVWVSDLSLYYAEACRILKPGGTFIVSEYHPFRRIWKDSIDTLEVQTPYFERGPHQYDRSQEVPAAEPGSLPSYEFNWTVSDYATAIMAAGCEILAMSEAGELRQDWERAPLQGLPESLLIVGKKRPEV